MNPNKKIRELEAIIVELREQIALLKKELYGRQSEKIPDASSLPSSMGAPANSTGVDEKSQIPRPSEMPMRWLERPAKQCVRQMLQQILSS